MHTSSSLVNIVDLPRINAIKQLMRLKSYQSNSLFKRLIKILLVKQYDIIDI